MSSASPSVYGAVRRNSNLQVTFCFLTSLGTTVERCTQSEFQRVIHTELVKLQKLLDNDDLSPDSACGWEFCTELRCKGLPSLLNGGRKADAPALARVRYSGWERRITSLHQNWSRI
ncbi:uncharacterized protein LOC130779048 [Actinidia eriantha]|uniref:uncharacterized protein LOC130779048 n=1 Tax=Actinidia eriantha TaxID=165200 RepID=UPI0025849B7E|nr:uncharacterized protein LOC130779048 [Actinidia eriantha]